MYYCLSRLPSGNFTFGSEVCDQQGACDIVVAAVNVTVTEPLSLNLDDLLASISQEAATGIFR